MFYNDVCSVMKVLAREIIPDRAFRHLATSAEATLGPPTVLSAAWVSEKIRIRLPM
jgi:hypothetical protein